MDFVKRFWDALSPKKKIEHKIVDKRSAVDIGKELNLRARRGAKGKNHVISKQKEMEARKELRDEKKKLI